VLKVLDLFLLALIADGLDTPYRWQRQAAVSTGASLPSVRRLAALGLVQEAEPGPRSSRRFSLTRAGRRELGNFTQYLQAALGNPNLDAESMLRLVSIAYVQGEQDLARRLLEQCALNRESRSSLDDSTRTPLPSDLAEFYSGALARYDHDRELAAIRSINALVKKTKPQPDRKGTVGTRRRKPR
jgi:hypothetical protein